MPGLVFIPQNLRAKPPFTWRDATVFIGLAAVMYGIFHTARAMGGPFSPRESLEISLSPLALPGYALRSLMRMYLAYAASMAFALVIGRMAAYNTRAEKVIIPFLDIMQSVPVLGFLSVSVTGFMTLFPGSLLGLEFASIFAIFSSMAWNIAFSFYQSLKTLPKDLHEAAINYRLTAWQRFIKLELPYAATGLVWNSMVSFGSGWFFLAASEAITVLKNDYKLPGLGSVMAEAVSRADAQAIAWTILAIIMVVVMVDQLFWRPIMAWSQRFRFERTDDDEATSAVLNLIRNAALSQWFGRVLLVPAGRRLDRAFQRAQYLSFQNILPRWSGRILRPLLLLAALVWAGPLMIQGVRAGISHFDLQEFLHVVSLGFVSSVRIVAVVVIATIVWVPVGVRIGFSPRLARISQPLVQIGAAFPANVIFPLITYVFLLTGVSLNWGSVLLLLAGTQWYVLFNVIAGAMQVPADLRDAAQVFHLRGWMLWRTLILPAIFPAWVTGALTAAGGAWNATIVAEVTTYGDRTLVATGLGAYLRHATEEGDWPGIVLSISVMCAFVVLFNRTVWQPLYAMAEQRYRVD